MLDIDTRYPNNETPLEQGVTMCRLGNRRGHVRAIHHDIRIYR